MSKAVLISIKPEWVEKIINGKKTIEIRKTAPKLETPFKVYVFCTSVKSISLNKYVDLHIKTSGKIDYWHEKVVAEFTCDEIIDYIPTDDKGKFTDYFITRKYPRDCLTKEERMKYGAGEWLYGWHISDLKVYDQPKELSEFLEPCIYGEGNEQCTLCDKSGYNAEMCLTCYNNVTRPPQSWCYVEEKE